MEIEVRDKNKNYKEMCGDLYFRLINANGGGLICRWSINTSFIDPDTNMIRLTKEMVDPDSIKKSNKFESNFSVTL